MTDRTRGDIVDVGVRSRVAGKGFVVQTDSGGRVRRADGSEPPAIFPRLSAVKSFLIRRGDAGPGGSSVVGW